MKKVLIITYYWPPSGGGGVQRWLKFSKYLPTYGWEPIIFTPENPAFDIRDESLQKDVNPDIEVLKLPIWEPYSLFESISGKKTPSQGLTDSKKGKSLIGEASLWLRGNLFIPDPRRFWVKPATKCLKDIINTNSIDVVVTTGPPHSMHLIGLRLKKQLDINWVADFRDPWSKWDMFENFKLSSLARMRHKHLEKSVLRHANDVITVSETWAEEFNNIYPRDYHVITNGFDEDDFNHQNKQDSEKFVISHFGLINAFRNPGSLWHILDSILKDRSDIELHLYGMIENEIIAEIKSYPALWKYTVIKPSVPHRDVLQAYDRSDLLLLLLNDSANAKGHLPGKLFEYLASGKNILALGPTDSDAADIIRKTKTGKIVDRESDEELKITLGKFLSGDSSHGDLSEVDKFSRKNLTMQLVAEVLSKYDQAKAAADDQL